MTDIEIIQTLKRIGFKWTLLTGADDISVIAIYVYHRENSLYYYTVEVYYTPGIGNKYQFSQIIKGLPSKVEIFANGYCGDPYLDKFISNFFKSELRNNLLDQLL